MINKEKKLFFKALYVWLADENLRKLIDKKKYSFIYIYSHKNLELDKSFSLTHKKIVNIYLNKSEEEIFNGFKRGTRQEINKTFSIKDLDYKMEDENLQETYCLYKKFEYKQDRTPWRINTFKGVLLFNAYFRGKIISSIPCYVMFPVLQARAMFSDRYEKDKEMQKIAGHATRRLVFEICKYAKERKYDYLGLGSINYRTEQKKNVSHFKTFFGGLIEDEYSYVYKSRSYSFFERFAALKAELFKLIKKN